MISMNAAAAVAHNSVGDTSKTRVALKKRSNENTKIGHRPLSMNPDSCQESVLKWVCCCTSDLVLRLFHLLDLSCQFFPLLA